MDRGSSARPRYLHGFTVAEQERLVAQAEYWSRSLIPVGLDYRAGDRVLEVGCAAGASLGVLARRFPGIRVAGIDREPQQIDFARRHLAAQGLDADLRVGDAAELPWDESAFDRVYVMWLLEHLREPEPILREAARVLRPGGTICVTETDYTTFKVQPPSRDYDYLAQAQRDYFARFGSAIAGRELGNLLCRAGFENVRNGPVGFHFFHGSDPSALRAHVEYVVGFLEPALGEFATALGRDRERLGAGLAHLRSVPESADGAMTQIVYRAHATRAASAGSGG